MSTLVTLMELDELACEQRKQRAMEDEVFYNDLIDQANTDLRSYALKMLEGARCPILYYRKQDPHYTIASVEVCCRLRTALIDAGFHVEETGYRTLTVLRKTKPVEPLPSSTEEE